MDHLLKETYDRLVDTMAVDSKRYLYPQFKPSRLTGLIGSRGVGKTTLLLQYIKEHLYKDNKTFYFSADSIYFQRTTLLEYVNELYLTEGFRIFFIDEIHKYNNWNQELKNIYDSFPDVQVIFSGSSMLDIVTGSYDLSRRANLYYLKGLSFREYLGFVTQHKQDPINFQSLIHKPNNYAQIGLIEKVKGHFRDYLAKGYYPFFLEDEHTYFERIINVIEKTIHEDIANYYKLNTQNLYIFKKILTYLASIPPGEVNTNNIAKNISVAHQTIFHYLTILESVGLLRFIYSFDGGNKLLRKPQKIFLNNTNLIYALNQLVGEKVNTGTLRELFFIQSLTNADIPCYYSKQGDYRTEKIIFEIGGKNKTNRQLATTKMDSFLVKDDLLVPMKGVLPLIYFGFLY